MRLPAALTETVRLPHIVYPVWQTRPLTAAERGDVETVLTELERRLVPANAATVRAIVEAAVKGGKSATATGAQADVDQLTAICTGYSEAHVRASLAACGGSDLEALATDLRRRRDNASTFHHRARVLLGLQTPHWWEVPGGVAPEGPDKPFEKPVFEKSNRPEDPGSKSRTEDVSKTEAGRRAA